MKKTKSKPQSNWLSPLLAYILSLLLVLLAVIGVCSITLCNGAFFKSQLLKSSFSVTVYGELTDNFISYGTPGGFSRELMTEFLSEDKIQSDMFASAERFYEGDRETAAHPEIKDAVLKGLTADLKMRGYHISSEIDSTLNEMAQTCANDYENYTKVPFASYLAPLLVKLQKIMLLPLMGLIVLIAATVVLLCLMHRKPENRMRYLIYAFSSAALLCAAFPLVLKLLVRMEHLNITPLSIKLFLGQYVSGLLSAFFYFAFMYLVVVIALGITLYTHYQKQRYAYEADKSEQVSPEDALGLFSRAPRMHGGSGKKPEKPKSRTR